MATTGIMRLNRPRYKESVAALKEMIADTKTPAARRLQAIETLLGIYDRHDRSQAQRQARNKADEPKGTGQPTAVDQTTNPQEETTEKFLERMRALKERGVQVED